MIVPTQSCFRSAALLSVRQPFAPFTRKTPQSRRTTPSTCNYSPPPSWFPQFYPEALLVQVSRLPSALVMASTHLHMTTRGLSGVFASMQ